MSRRSAKSSSARQRTSGAVVKDASDATAAIPSSQQKSWNDDDDDDNSKGDQKGFEHWFGFHWRELCSFESFVRLLCRPCDPASLGTMRVMFGVLMTLDILQERGLGNADARWGDATECRYPLFDFLKPLPLQYMYLLYLVMLVGACGLMLGFKYRLSCALFVGPYWYIFFLDKSSWNNHSYLFGILGFFFLITDGNRYWSLDGFFNPKICNSHVPLWNYTLLRAQIFLVYFIAGLKKMDYDWVSGYSMQDLSDHWVFQPFSFFLSGRNIDLFIVHLGGLTIDTCIGFLLFFDKTRTLGLVISSSFHCMNSQIFSIGMFPYAMLATQFLFCAMSWPRQIFKQIPACLALFTPMEEELQPSDHCLYRPAETDNTQPSKTQSSHSSTDKPHLCPNKASFKHKAAAVFTVLFIAWQCFLPYSHGLTKGYNNWTNGLYGYSWDMMVHSWRSQHVRITYVDKDTGQSGYLNPQGWTGSKRWTSHTDMIKQYSACIAENLKSHGIYNVELYFDIWKSLNHRFQQRMVHPHVDILQAEWHPFKETSWLMPLMVDLSNWRNRLSQIENQVFNYSEIDVVFVADFPGLYLENYVQSDFGNTSLSVLDGEVLVELLDSNENITLGPGKSLQIPADTFHNVHTISSVPSCYMYMFVNTTEEAFLKNFSRFEDDVKQSSLNETLEKYTGDPHLDDYQKLLKDRKDEEETESSLFEVFKKFLWKKYVLVCRSFRMSCAAVLCLIRNESFEEFLNHTYTTEVGQLKPQGTEKQLLES